MRLIELAIRQVVSFRYLSLSLSFSSTSNKLRLPEDTGNDRLNAEHTQVEVEGDGLKMSADSMQVAVMRERDGGERIGLGGWTESYQWSSGGIFFGETG